MKRFLLPLFVTMLTTCSFIGCSQQKQWNREQRQALREMLRDYRKMVYLNNLTEAEYMLFTDQVLASVEEDYPVYTTFVEMPGANDTVQVYVVTTIVEQLNTDARNMRHLFPYNTLVESNILPSGLDRTQQNAFYRCLAQRVNNTYPTIDSFVNAVVSERNRNVSLTAAEGKFNVVTLNESFIVIGLKSEHKLTECNNSFHFYKFLSIYNYGEINDRYGMRSHRSRQRGR